MTYPKLIHGDCLTEMKSLKDNSVDLIVTSPPYAKQRKYNGASSDNYIEFISPIVKQMKRIIKEDGNIIINIKEHCNNGCRELYVLKMIIHLVEEVNLNFIDEFIWVKTNPFPTGAKTRLKDGYERLLHFTKSSNYNFFPNNVLVKSTSKWLESEKRRKNKDGHNVRNGSGMNMSKRVVNDMVRPSNVITGSTSNININHPAVYPEYLPEFFIKLMSNEKDTVLDPFMGSGTTGVVCDKLNRKFIGIELDEDYYSEASMRILDLI